nr:hypothetical protein [Candidatus Sigynarchaeota archaeon]
MVDQATLDEIRLYKESHPEATYSTLAALFHVSKSTVLRAFKGTGPGTNIGTSTGLVLGPGNPGGKMVEHLLLLAEPVIDRGVIVKFRYKEYDKIEWVEIDGKTIGAVLDHITSQGYSLVSKDRVHGSELRFSKPFQGEYELIFKRAYHG